MKVLFVGPSKAGKTSIISFLSGIQDGPTPSATPSPTVGVRILELERHGTPVELWDVSGDQSYETTWPAVHQGATAVVLIYDPEALGQAREIELWYSWFVEKAGINPSQTVCWALSNSGFSGQTVPPAAIGGVQSETFFPRGDGGEGVRRAFERFIDRLRK